jgi:hypothetical protein
MARISGFYNRIKHATSTTGTGTPTLGSASTGFFTAAEAGVTDGSLVSYLIEEGNDFECGYGTYNSAGPTITRTTVTGSKISGTAGTAKMNLAGSATISIVPLAADLAIVSDYATAERQNNFLSWIYQSKLYAGYRRGIQLFADGYKASDGVASGSSSNYSVTTASGYVSPTASGSDTVAAQSMTADNAGWSGYGIRQLISSAALAANGTSVRITITGPSAGTALVLTDCFIGQAGTAPSFSTTPTRITFNGGSNGVTVPVGGSVTSDVVTFSISTANSYIVAMGVTSGDFREKTSATNFTRYYKASGSGETGTQTVSGYSNVASDLFGVSRVEVNIGYNNMTVVTTAQTADASVSTARGLIEFDNSATPTLNTDLTLEFTCNGGTNWTSATLSSVSTNGQGGRKIADTGEVTCTAGTSFQARLKTLNNKNVPVYGLAMQVR